MLVDLRHALPGTPVIQRAVPVHGAATARHRRPRAVAVSEYDPGTHQATVRVLAGPEEKLRKLPSLLGRDAAGMAFTVAEGTLHEWPEADSSVWKAVSTT